MYIVYCLYEMSYSKPIMWVNTKINELIIAIHVRNCKICVIANIYIFIYLYIYVCMCSLKQLWTT